VLLKKINILNKRARYDYEIIEKIYHWNCFGGTEIKSIRLESKYYRKFCEFSGTELLQSILILRNILLEINLIIKLEAKETFAEQEKN
jgi:hypothetical protein